MSDAATKNSRTPAKDVLGWFVPGGDFSHLSAKALRRYTAMADRELSDIITKSVSKESWRDAEMIRVVDAEARRRFRQLVVVSDLAVELFVDDKTAAARWIMGRNEFLFGHSPFEVVLSGGGEVIEKFLLERLGRTIPQSGEPSA